MIFTNLPNPIRETRVLKLVFRTITCLKFWAQYIFTVQFSRVCSTFYCLENTHKGQTSFFLLLEASFIGKNAIFYCLGHLSWDQVFHFTTWSIFNKKSATFYCLHDHLSLDQLFHFYCLKHLSSEQVFLFTACNLLLEQCYFLLLGWYFIRTMLLFYCLWPSFFASIVSFLLLEAAFFKASVSFYCFGHLCSEHELLFTAWSIFARSKLWFHVWRFTRARTVLLDKIKVKKSAYF